MSTALENLEWLPVAASVSTILASVAVCFTAVLVLRQVGMQSDLLVTDNRRFARESLSYVFDALHNDAFRAARTGMLATLNAGNHTPTQKPQIDQFRVVLNTYEMLGLCVKVGSIDAESWKAYWRTTFVRDWERLKEFVDVERSRFTPSLFVEAERIYEAWKE